MLALAMKTLRGTLGWMLAAALVVAAIPMSSEAKGYSSGGHSYSSSSSHGSSFSGGRSSSGGSRNSGGKSYQSGGGKSYSSGSSWSGANNRSYGSGKSYSAGGDRLFGSHSGNDNKGGNGGSGRFTFDTAAARARKEAASGQDYARFKDSQRAPGAMPNTATPRSGASSYQAQPPIIHTTGGGYYRTPIYVPDATVLVTRPVRLRTFYAPYYSRPLVVYQDPYSSFFWWWLLDRSLDDRASWAYHHRYDMDPVRYQSLLATDQALETRVAQLEAQQVARDPHYVPTGLDRDLMYSDGYVAHAYNNRPTLGGRIAFWVLGVSTALAVTGFFIWLIWFKRWQTAT